MVEINKKETEYLRNLLRETIQSSKSFEDEFGHRYYAKINELFHKKSYKLRSEVSENVTPREINDVSNRRINFDSDLMDESIAEVVVDLPYFAEKDNIRSFRIEADDIYKYFPPHTKYIKENAFGTHRIGFIVQPTYPSEYGLGENESAQKVKIEFHSAVYPLQEILKGHNNCFALGKMTGMSKPREVQRFLEKNMKHLVFEREYDEYVSPV